MHCDKCGRDVAEGSVFCPQCGQRLGDLANVAGSAAAGAGATPAERLRSSDGHAPQPPEEELWTGTYSPKAMLGTAMLVALIVIASAVGASFSGAATAWMAWLAVALMLGACLGALVVYRKLAVRYRLTSCSFFHETGILSVTSNRIQVIDVDDITLHQGPMERMLGIGTIVLQSTDRTEPELKLRGIEAAARVADIIDAARRAERNRRGLYVQQM